MLLNTRIQSIDLLMTFSVQSHGTFLDLFRIIPQRRSSYITRNLDEIPLFNTKHTC